MTNIFKKIGDNLEKSKLEKRKIEDNYWKLSPLERMDYDQKVERIKRNQNRNGFNFEGTRSLLMVLLFMFGMIGVVYWISPMVNIFDYLEQVKNLLSRLWRLILFMPLLDLLMDLISIFIDIEKKQIKELNKRFKLIK